MTTGRDRNTRRRDGEPPTSCAGRRAHDYGKGAFCCGAGFDSPSPLGRKPATPRHRGGLNDCRWEGIKLTHSMLGPPVTRRGLEGMGARSGVTAGRDRQSGRVALGRATRLGHREEARRRDVRSAPGFDSRPCHSARNFGSGANPEARRAVRFGIRAISRCTPAAALTLRTPWRGSPDRPMRTGKILGACCFTARACSCARLMESYLGSLPGKVRGLKQWTGQNPARPD